MCDDMVDVLDAHTDAEREACKLDRAIAFFDPRRSFYYAHHLPSRGIFSAEHIVPSTFFFGDPRGPGPTSWKALLQFLASRCARLSVGDKNTHETLEVELRMGVYDQQTKLGVTTAWDTSSQLQHEAESRVYAALATQRMRGAGNGYYNNNNNNNNKARFDVQTPVVTGGGGSGGGGGTPDDHLCALMAVPLNRIVGSETTHMSESRWRTLLMRMTHFAARRLLFYNVTTGEAAPIRESYVASRELIYDTLPTLDERTRFRKVFYGNTPGPASSKRVLWSHAVSGVRLADMLYFPSVTTTTTTTTTAPSPTTHVHMGANNGHVIYPMRDILHQNMTTSSALSSSMGVSWPLLDAKICVSSEIVYPTQVGTFSSAQEKQFLPSAYVDKCCSAILDKQRTYFHVGCVELSFTRVVRTSPVSNGQDGRPTTSTDYQVEIELRLPHAWAGRSSPGSWVHVLQEMFYWWLFLNYTPHEIEQ